MEGRYRDSASNRIIWAFAILLVLCLAAGCDGLSCGKAKNRVEIVLELDRTNVPAEELDSVMERTLATLTKRVKQFGIRGQTVVREGENRIVVQLPGDVDPERAKLLIGQTALLEFIIVKTADETRELLDRLDSFVAARVPAAADTVEFPYFDPERPITSRMLTIEFGGVFFGEREVPDVQRFIDEAGADTLLPLEARLSWSAEPEYSQGRPGRVLYFLNKKAELTGAEVATARVAMDLDPDRPDAPGVLLSFTRGGTTTFSSVTGNNVGRQLAIVLDGRVFSPPVIRQKISGGEASVTGNFSDKEARDLAICLRAGALPAPLSVVEVRQP